MIAPKRLVIATRQSKLALIQARHVRDRLRERYPQCDVALLGVTTEGDRRTDRPLFDLGGKGLFIKELEQALAECRADLAVHSLKDVPMTLPDGFALTAILAREDPRDAFISLRCSSPSQMSAGTVVGTSSLRREAQLRARYGALDIQPLRGNVDTRLRKLDQGEFVAIVLAVAGLKRLGVADRITAILSFDEMLPAAGQGALAIECRAEHSSLHAQLAFLHDERTAVCVRAERAFARVLGADCRTPVAAYAQVENKAVWLRGLLAGDEGVIRRVEGRADIAESERLGDVLARSLLADDT